MCSDKISSFNDTVTGCTADCHVGCPVGTYRLPGMVDCKPRLNCTQIRSLTKDRNLIGGGGVKRVSTPATFGVNVYFDGVINNVKLDQAVLTQRKKEPNLKSHLF